MREGAIQMLVQQARRETRNSRNALLLVEARREQAERARRRQEAGRRLARESAGAYEDFLDSVFFYYGENARAAEKGTGEG